MFDEIDGQRIQAPVPAPPEPRPATSNRLSLIPGRARESFVHPSAPPGALLPKRNYGFEKRQKEIARKQKQEDKRQRKLDRAQRPPAETSPELIEPPEPQPPE